MLLARPLILRRIRIAVSVAGLIAGAAFAAMWVRSYWRLDRVRMGSANAVASLEGRLILNDVFNINSAQPQLMGSFVNRRLAGNTIQFWSVRRGALLPVGLGTTVRYCYLVAGAVAITVVPWIKGRFSLRALLLAITLVAVLLWLMQHSI